MELSVVFLCQKNKILNKSTLVISDVLVDAGINYCFLIMRDYEKEINIKYGIYFKNRLFNGPIGAKVIIILDIIEIIHRKPRHIEKGKFEIKKDHKN